MSRLWHIEGARGLLMDADDMLVGESGRAAGELLWGAFGDAALALAHIDGERHAGRMRITDYRRILGIFADSGILRSDALALLRWSVIPLHENFYRRGLDEDAIISHAAICKVLIEEMLAIRVLDEDIDGA